MITSHDSLNSSKQFRILYIHCLLMTVFYILLIDIINLIPT